LINSYITGRSALACSIAKKRAKELRPNGCFPDLRFG